jgi:hypothetical protein
MKAMRAQWETREVRLLSDVGLEIVLLVGEEGR